MFGPENPFARVPEESIDEVEAAMKEVEENEEEITIAARGEGDPEELNFDEAA